jgi:hypothetical protein
VDFIWRTPGAKVVSAAETAYKVAYHHYRPKQFFPTEKVRDFLSGLTALKAFIFPSLISGGMG